MIVPTKTEELMYPNRGRGTVDRDAGQILITLTYKVEGSSTCKLSLLDGTVTLLQRLINSVTMKLSLLFLSAATLASASVIAIEDGPIPAGASISLPGSASSLSRFLQPRHNNKEHKKDNWGNAIEKDRKKITIRASKHDRDDISSDFLWALKKANRGGLVHLEKGKKFVIGKKLDLTFLKDVYVKIDGELKFTDDIEYWQANNFYYAFQKSITFWVWGGK
jgi:galacturan 1,4-alpha-galacturonidase